MALRYLNQIRACLIVIKFNSAILWLEFDLLKFFLVKLNAGDHV